MSKSVHKLIQFQNCSILRDHRIIKEDFWVRNEKIINPEPLFFEEKVVADILVDCKGALLAPGLIDLQINGGFGIDFSHDVNSVEEGINKVSLGILSHGVTSFCPTIITSSPDKYRKILPLIKRREGSSMGAGILGVHLEGPFISREKKGAHSVQYIRSFEEEEAGEGGQEEKNGIADILDVYGTLKDTSIITLAPELDSTGCTIKKLIQLGITVSLGHSSGNLSDGEKAVKAGASLITHLFNAMLPFHHRDPGLVGLLTSDNIPDHKTVYYGIIADGIHTHPAALRIAFKSHAKGLVLVTDAISAMGLQEGTHYIGEEKVQINGNKACIAGTNTLCGSIATLNNCIQYFHKEIGCSKVEALECATLHPALCLGISQNKGTLDFNSDADFIMLDENLNLLATFIAGECVYQIKNTKIEYKNNPLAN